jgi:hypothetical protein
VSLGVARLLAYDVSAQRRRLLARPVYSRWLGLPGVPAVLAGLAGATLIAWRARSSDDGFTLWLTGALVGVAVIILRGPWRLYWRPGALLLARLPIPGSMLYGLAVARTASAAVQVFVVIGLASIPFARDARALLPVLALLAGSCVCAALVSPAMAVFAGAIIVWEKAKRSLEWANDELAASRVTWLGLLPALGVAFVAGGVLVLVPWATGRPSRVDAPAALAAGLLFGSVFLLVAGLRVARTSLAAATGEVATMDRIRLAHVDLVGARGLERWWGRLIAPGVVYTKDVAVLRRRFPMYYLLNGAAVLALWIAASGEPVARGWVIGVCVATGTYTLALARRLATPPAEPALLRAVLPFPTAALLRAKFSYLTWRTLWLFGAGATPAIVRSGDRSQLALIVAGIAIGSLVTGAILLLTGLRQRSHLAL